MTASKPITSSDLRHALAVESVFNAVGMVTRQLLAHAGVLPCYDGYTHDLASNPVRENMLHSSIARTSAVRRVKDYFLETSKPVIETMFRATDSTPIKHGSRGPQR